MLDALLAGVVVDDAGTLVRDLDARTISRCCRRAATGGTAYRLHRKMEARHRRALLAMWEHGAGDSPLGFGGIP